MSQSYRKYEITTTFKQEICRNLTFPLRLRQILIINAQIKDFKIRNKALVSNFKLDTNVLWLGSSGIIPVGIKGRIDARRLPNKFMSQ